MRLHPARRLAAYWGPLALVAVSLASLRGCGSAAKDLPGRCKAVSGASYVGAATDTDGKAWTFDLSPAEFTLKCYSATDRGVLTFTGVVRDSLNQAKAGLVTNPVVSLGGGLAVINDTESDAFFQSYASERDTDACGVVVYNVKWFCPEAGKTNQGVFYAHTGALFSKPANIVIEHYIPTPIPSVIVGPAPATP